MKFLFQLSFVFFGACAAINIGIFDIKTSFVWALFVCAGICFTNLLYTLQNATNPKADSHNKNQIEEALNNIARNSFTPRNNSSDSTVNFVLISSKTDGTIQAEENETIKPVITTQDYQDENREENTIKTEYTGPNFVLYGTPYEKNVTATHHNIQTPTSIVSNIITFTVTIFQLCIDSLSSLYSQKTHIDEPSDGVDTSDNIYSKYTHNVFKKQSRLKKAFASFSIIALVASSIIFTQYVIENTPNVYAVSNPTTTANIPAESQIGEEFTFEVTFSNTGTTPGFGPYIDLLFPATGIDGDDGIEFVSASYLGANVTAVVLPFTSPSSIDPNPCPSGQFPVEHPYALDTNGDAVVICGNENDHIIVLQLPFGSFVPDQPDAVVEITAETSELADADTPLTIQHRAGFMYGDDSLANPSTDPSKFGSFTSETITPQIFSVEKIYVGPENETATGPNFPRQYIIRADIADGQTITDLDLIDNLPNTLVFSQLVSASPAGGSIITQPTTTPANAPDNQIVYRFPSVTGGTSTNDAEIILEVYVNDIDANGNPVINPTTGGDTTTLNDGLGQGTWTPIDPRDPTEPLTSDAAPIDHTLTNKSIAIQKAVTNTSPGPARSGSVLEYTASFQISDYFAFDSFVLTDILSDGQLVDTSFTPQYSITEQGNTSNGTFIPANWSDTKETGFLGASGDTTIVFNLSDQLVSDGEGSALLGGCVTGTGTPDCDTQNNGATTGSITYRAVIQETYTDNPAGEAVVLGDRLDNFIEITADVLDTTTLQPTGSTESDQSTTVTPVVTGGIQKEVFAINGSSSFPANTRIGPGDVVTYRIAYTLPVSDVDGLKIMDYLPLPTFDADSVTTFNATVDATIPPAGTAKFGPNDTFFGISGITPTMTINSGENSVEFMYGDYNDTNNSAETIELYLSVEASPEPFADGLILMNQASASTENTGSEQTISNSITPIVIALPNVEITKGIVATSNSNAVFTQIPEAPVTFNTPGSTTCTTANHRFTGSINSTNLDTTPIDSDLSNNDAFDLVTYALTLENSGQSTRGAFDVQVKDTPAPLMTIPAGGINMCVTDGNGNPIPWTPVNPADPNPLLGDGIELVDPTTIQGAIRRFDPANPSAGDNVVIITYDLETDGTIQPVTEHENTAELTNYTAIEGGTNFVTDPIPTTSALVTTAEPAITKQVLSTNHTGTTGNDVVIGEIITYQTEITVPEGQMNQVEIVDNMNNGIAFVDITSITASADLSTSIAGGFTSVASGVTVGPDATDFSLDFGTITNTNSNNNIQEAIIIEYRVVVVNDGNTNNGQQKTNQIELSFNNGEPQTYSTTSNPVTIREPQLAVTKNAVQTTADANDVVDYTITIQHTGGSTAHAYDVVLTDVIPAEVTYNTGTVSASGTAPTSLNVVGTDVIATFDTFLQGSSTTITFQATVNTGVSPSQVVTNDVEATWTSLPGDITSPQTPNNGNSVERTGDTADPGAIYNDYTTTDSASFSVDNLVLTKELVSTSEDYTTGNDVAIGEIVRYKLITEIPEAGVDGFEIEDNLPSRLQFVNDGTSRIALVSNGGLTSSDPAVNACIVTGNTSTITPTCDASPFLTGTTFGSGTDPVWAIGDITNGDNDADAEFIILELNTVVLNETGNQAFNNSNGATTGTARNNNFSIFSNPTGGSRTNLITSGNRRIDIAEPVLQIEKTMALTPQDAGDAGQYRITVENIASGSTASPAFEIELLDTIPSEVTTTGITVSTIPGYVVTTDNSNIGLNELELLFSELQPGDSIEVLIDFTVNTTTQAGLTFSNTATASYTSLRGNGADGTNPTGSPAGAERNGADGAGGLNDYVDIGTAFINLDEGSIDKNNANGTTFTIGEYAEFDIVATLAEGQSINTIVRDTLPAGLAYDSHQIFTTTADSALLTSDFSGTFTTQGFANNTPELDFTFGNVTLPADNDNTNNSFVIRIRTLVQDLNSNQNNTTLTNNVELRTDDPITGDPQIVQDTTPPQVTVLVPIVGITKTFIPDTISPNGNTTIRIEITNTGGSTAYDYSITDTFDTTEFSSLSPQPTTGYTSTVNNIGTDSTITYSGDQLDPGETHTFDILATVDGSLPNGYTIPNTAFLDNTSTLPGTDVNERTLPQITASDTLNIVTPDLAITKASNQSSIVPGDTMIYTLDVINNGQFQADNVVVTEFLSPNSTFNNGASTLGWSTVNGTEYTINIGTLTPGQSTSLLFAVTVNDPVPAGFDTLNNTATVGDDGQNGADPTPADNTTTDSDPIIAQPELSITIDDSLTNTATGNTQSYVITVTNNGSQTATGVETIHDIPDNTTLIAVTGGPTQAGNTLTWNELSLDPGDSFTYVVTVQVNNTIPAGVNTIDAEATVSDDGTNGPDPIPGNNTDTDSDILEAAPDLTITKDDGLTQVVPGQTVTYTITVENVGDQEATGVVITDQIPAGTTFAGASNGGTESGGVVTWPATSLAVNNTLSRTISVVLDSSFDAGIDTITNSVSAQDDGTNGVDPTPENNSDTDVDDLDAVPDLVVLKDDGQTSASISEELTYTITVENVGTQTATGVVVTETIPTHTTFTGDTNIWTCIGTTCTATIPQITAGATETLTFVVTVDSSVPANIDTITNSVSAQDDGTNGVDPTPENNSDTDVDDLDAVPDLVVSKDNGITQVVPGQTVTYVITVTNAGNQTATGAEAVDILPNQLSYVSNSCGATQGINQQEITWLIGTISPNTSISCIITAEVSSTVSAGIDTITNTVSVTDDGTNGVDPTPENNSDTDVDDLDAVPDLVIDIDDAGITTETNSPITYTIDYENVGLQGATGSTIFFTVPDNTTFNTATNPGWVCAPPTNPAQAGAICQLDIGNINAGESGSTTITVITNPTLPDGVDEITINTTISDDGTNGVDPTPANNADTEVTPIEAEPDMQITIDDGEINVTPNQTLTYTVTYTNIGDQTATGVTALATLPQYTTLISATNSPSQTGNTLTWSVPAVLPGQTITETFTVTIDATIPSGIDTITAIANVIDDGTNGVDPTPANNADDDIDILDANPDLEIIKTDSGATIIPGDSIEYTLSYTNSGNQDATGVVITDVVPPSSVFNATNSTAGWSCADGDPAGTTCTISIGNLNTGDSGTVLFVTTIVNPLGAGVDEITNTATIADDGTNGVDPTPENNTSSELTTVDGLPDLFITKTDNGVITEPSEVLIYDITYGNSGNQDATGVVITETVPVNTTFNGTNSTPGWSCADGDPAGTTCEFILGNLDAGTTNNLVFAVQVLDSVASNTVSIINTTAIEDDGTNGVDPTPENNIDNEDTPVISNTLLTIAKDDGITSMENGDQTTFTIIVENLGNQDADQVVITDSLPSEYSFISATGSPVVSGQTIEWSIGTLQGGQSVSFDLTVQLAIPAPIPAGFEDITNTVSVVATNNPEVSAEDTNIVIANPDLEITKTNNSTIMEIGEVSIYEITVVNTGNQTASGITITDTLPTDTTYAIAQSTPGWNCILGSCTYQIGSLEPNTPLTILLAVTLDANTPETEITNGVTVVDDGTSGEDPTPENNSDTDTDITVGEPDLEVIKTDNQTSVAAGETVTYEITVTNIGNIVATGIEITDTLPPLMSAVSASNSGTISTDLQTVTWNGFTLTPGESITVTIDAQLTTPIPAGEETVTNSASSITDGVHGEEPNLENNSDTDTDDIDAAPDLEITETILTSDLAPGDDVEIEINYSNIGTQDATGVVMTFSIPSNTELQNLPAGWTCSGTTAGSICTFTIGDLDVGDSGTETIIVTVLPNDSIDFANPSVGNVVTIQDDGGNGEEITLVNNVDDDTEILKQIDLVVEKTTETETAFIQDTVTYQFIFRNLGPDVATEVVMEDILPADLEFIEARRDGQVINTQVTPQGDGTTLLTFDIGTIVPGPDEFLEVDTKIIAGQPTDITNTVFIKAREADPEVSNNRSEAVISVILPAGSGGFLARTGGYTAIAAYSIVGLIILGGAYIQLFAKEKKKL